jgi:hypothetical protein
MHREYCVLTDIEGKAKIYNFNENTYIFACKEEEWDRNGWRDKDGLTFKQKLNILNFSSDVAWKRIYDEELYSLMKYHRVLSPNRLSVVVKEKKVEFYIKYNIRRQRLKLYCEVKCYKYFS